MKTQALNQLLKGVLIAVFVLPGILSVRAQSSNAIHLIGTKDTNTAIFQTDLKTGNRNLANKALSFLNNAYNVVFVKENNNIFDDTWNENNTISYSDALETTGKEEEIALENWMTNFNVATSGEKEMKLESWMSNFNEEMVSYEESEEEMQLEPWMSNFNVTLNAQNEDSVTEPEMKVEKWMLDLSQWDEQK